MTQIRVAEQFSRYPIGRYTSDGGSSGEAFRENLLFPALNTENSVVIVYLDGVAGYPSSFLEEAFGGLVREHGFTERILRERMKLKYDNVSFSTYVDEIWEYISDAEEAHSGTPSPIAAAM